MKHCGYSQKKREWGLLFSDILTSYLKLFRQDSPPLHQDWIPLTVAIRKDDKFTVVLIKLNKSNMEDLT